MSIIDREQAVKLNHKQSYRYSGITKDNGRNYWIFDNLSEARVDHCEIRDDETLAGCLHCGMLVEPEDDDKGCGCHCPDCGSAL